MDRDFILKLHYLTLIESIQAEAKLLSIYTVF